jgi:DNA-binding transcriptional ArsR family regulator
MVHYQPAQLDAVFGALADPTRRAVLARLQRGGHSVGDLAGPFGMSLTGFIKHLRILEDAGLIERRKTGRVVNCRLKEGALKGALEWLDRHEAFWNSRLDRLGTFLERKEHDRWKPQPSKAHDSPSAEPTTRRSPKSMPRGRTRRR